MANTKKREGGRNAIVTGASRKLGIGAAVARALARDGWNVLTSCWRPYDAAMPWGSRNDEAEELIRELKRHRVRAALHEDDWGIRCQLKGSSRPPRIRSVRCAGW